MKWLPEWLGDLFGSAKKEKVEEVEEESAKVEEKEKVAVPPLPPLPNPSSWIDDMMKKTTEATLEGMDTSVAGVFKTETRAYHKETVDCGLHPDGKHEVTAILHEGVLKGFSGLCDRRAAEALGRLGEASCYQFFARWTVAARGEGLLAASYGEEKTHARLRQHHREARDKRMRPLPEAQQGGRIETSRATARRYVQERLVDYEMQRTPGGFRVTAKGNPPTSYHYMISDGAWVLGSGPGDQALYLKLASMPRAVMRALLRKDS